MKLPTRTVIQTHSVACFSTIAIAPFYSATTTVPIRASRMACCSSMVTAAALMTMTVAMRLTLVPWYCASTISLTRVRWGELTEPQEDCPTKPLANVYPDNDGNFSELKPCNQPRGITLARMHGISPDSMADTANTARSFGEGAALHAKTFELHDGLALVADGATLKIFDVRSTLASELTRAESVDSANAVIGTAAEAQPVAELTLVSGGGQVEALTVATGTSGEQRVWLLLSTDEVVEVRIPANPAFAVESFRQSLPPLPSVEEGTSVDYAALAVRLDAQAGDRLYVLKASSDRSLSSIETFDLSAGLSLRGSTGLDQGFFTTRSFNNVVRLVAQQDSLYLPLNGGDPVVRVFALTGDGGLLDELKLKGRISIQNRLNDFDVNQRGQLFAGRRAKGTPIYAADAVGATGGVVRQRY